MRILVALPQARTSPKGSHRPPPLDAPGVSSGAGASQVPRSLLIEAAPQEARTERAGRGTHPDHRRTQVAQSAVRLSTDCVHHLADVRDRHRQERRLPGAVETLSPDPGRPRALVVVVHRPHQGQPVERGPLSMRVDRAPELLGARGHGPIHTSPGRRRRALRCRHGRRRLPHVQRRYSRAGPHRDISVRITIRSSRRSVGRQTCEFWRSTKSRPSRMCLCRTHSWSA